MIAIVDTGGANIASLVNAFHRLGQGAELTDSKEKIRSASHVILPGVGSAGSSMERIGKSELRETIRSLQQPVLGICLGMQLLFSESEEGNVPCIGILPGKVEKIPAREGFSVPHMGWNSLAWSDSDFCLARGIPKESFFYFVHSFIAPKGNFVRATCDHGVVFPAVVSKNNFYGVQFHPERSALAGAQLLQNFLELK